MGLLDRLASTLAGAADITDDVRASVERAFAEGAGGNWAVAEASLLELARRAPENPAVFVALGEVRVRRGHDEAAVESFGRAVDLSAATVDGWLGLGEALIRLGRFEPAREALRKVLSRTSEPSRRARAHAGRGRVALALAEPARAVRELRQAAELAPRDYAIAHDLGRALRAGGDDEAFAWLVRAAHAPTPEPGWVLTAVAAAPSAAEAEALLRDALAAEGTRAFSPADRAELEAALAGTLGQSGRDEEALPVAEAASRAAPDSAVGARAVARIHEQAGRYPEALAASLRASALGDAASKALDRPALIRLALGAQDRAALAALGAEAPADDSLAAAARAFADGQARDEDLVLLGMQAPDEASRLFIARAVAPGAIPTGNLYALLTYARELGARAPELTPLLPLAARAVEALDRPLLVAVMGEFNAGKSSFVNALCGEKVARVGVTPTTATINVLRYGPRGARLLYHDGRAEEIGAEQIAPRLAALDDRLAAAVRLVELFVPLELLRQVEVVDTPGLNSLRPEHEQVARGFLTEADAIVWLFSAVQAAKATERDALALAQAAGKRALGVLNKADQASPDELEELRAHILASLGDRIELLIPFSARQAQSPTDDNDGGLQAVRAALDERFFSKARALKRETALGALRRFVEDAHAASERTLTALPADDGAGLARLEAMASSWHGALAAERLRLRARLEAGLRQVAAEVAELMQPRLWPFSDRRSAAEDLTFLLDLLDDAVSEATAPTARELADAAAGGPALPIAEAVARFQAYARGLFRGGVAIEFQREYLVAGAPRVDLPQLQRALAARLPDAEGELFTPLEAAAAAAIAEARQALAAAVSRAAMARLVLEERLARPVAALAAAVETLARATD